jgi:uncharacterized protein DUF222/HNH endonuclease
MRKLARPRDGTRAGGFTSTTTRTARWSSGGRLTPEAGALLVKALEAAGETLYQRRRKDESSSQSADQPTDPPSPAQRRADALELVAEAALHQRLDPGHPAEHYQVVVHVDAPILSDPDQPGQSVLETGTHVSAETSQRLSCDATRVVMKHDADGRITEVGARTRTMPYAGLCSIGTVVAVSRAVAFGQGHHLRHWARGGPTTLSNLALLCRRHHRAVHEEGYRVEREPDGTLQFRRQDGRPFPDVPLAPPLEGDPVDVLRSRDERTAQQIHASTAIPRWCGERLDLGWAIDVLHPLAMRARTG